MYEYQADVVNVVDGDTIDVNIDLGFKIRHEFRGRLVDIDTHEIHFVAKESEEFERGMQEKEYVEDWIEQGQVNHMDRFPFIVRSSKKDGDKGSYGRYLIDIERKSDGSVLTAEILETFEDVEY